LDHVTHDALSLLADRTVVLRVMHLLKGASCRSRRAYPHVQCRKDMCRIIGLPSGRNGRRPPNKAGVTRVSVNCSSYSITPTSLPRRGGPRLDLLFRQVCGLKSPPALSLCLKEDLTPIRPDAGFGEVRRSSYLLGFSHLRLDPEVGSGKYPCGIGGTTSA